MKKTPTLLMKELKYLSLEINKLYEFDKTNSFVPVNEKLDSKYDNNYNYLENRNKIDELYQKERNIKKILNEFNVNTYLQGTNMTIQEALVRISQLQQELTILTKLASKREYYTEYVGTYTDKKEVIYHLTYDLNKVNEDLKKVQKELTFLQMSVDKINLSSFIEC